MSLINNQPATMGADTNRLLQWLTYQLWMEGSIQIEWQTYSLAPSDIKEHEGGQTPRLFPFLQWAKHKSVHIPENELDIRTPGVAHTQPKKKLKSGKARMEAINWHKD
eukprot:1641849-Rhodomonas_salina.1